MVVHNSLAISLKPTLVPLAFIIKSIVLIHPHKMVAPKGNTAMGLKRLALLFHSHIPTHFWVEAFSTAAYIINRLPTPLLEDKSHFQLLYGSSPNYEIFHPFGCRVYPCLRDYMTNKFSPQSILCVFMVIIHLIKVFIVLTLPPPESILPAMLNLTKPTFLFTKLPKPNPYPLSKSQLFWNLVSLPQTCPCFLLHQTLDIFLNPDPPHVLFVLIQWMTLYKQLILI